ncbi:MAG TPA: 5-formyltetrahydrofolate cyclo-ligase [Trebonia sp.]|jgi:5-formyltetrahydrofolate cyclo-ligase
MPSLGVVPDDPGPAPAAGPVPGPGRRHARRDGGGPPLYRQVCDQVEALAMAAELGDERPLPPEGQLIARFGVSRGTLRRATDELARQGLLRIEPGRGTFVVQATKVRWLVWDRLVAVARPDSRFDLDLSRFVPDFAGRERCDEQLRALPGYAGARTVFLAPDNSLETMRRYALDDGKRVVVPSYGLRRGFMLLDPAGLDPAGHRLAATLDGMEQLGRRLSLAEVRELSPVDLVVSGAVAVTRRGLHFGGGDGFFDLEWGLLRHCGLVTARTPVVVVAHDCQVLDADIRPAPHDAVADTVITPSGILACTPPLPKPDGIFWDEIRGAWADSGIPYVRDLVTELDPGPAGQPARLRWREGDR